MPMAISSSNCACGLAHLERIPRRTWMRWLPWLRYYQCTLCGGRRRYGPVRDHLQIEENSLFH